MKFLLPFLGLMLFGCQPGSVTYPPGDPRGPINPVLLASGQKSIFVRYEMTGGETIKQPDTLAAEVTALSGVDATLSFRERGRPYGDTLAHEATYRRSDGSLISGDPAYNFIPESFSTLSKVSLAEMASGPRFEFDGPIPRSPAGGALDFHGYGGNMLINGHSYPKVPFACSNSGMPDAGTACMFFSEDGKLLRQLGYGGFIAYQAGYWDLEN